MNCNLKYPINQDIGAQLIIFYKHILSPWLILSQMTDTRHLWQIASQKWHIIWWPSWVCFDYIWPFSVLILTDLTANRHIFSVQLVFWFPDWYEWLVWSIWFSDRNVWSLSIICLHTIVVWQDMEPHWWWKNNWILWTWGTKYKNWSRKVIMLIVWSSVEIF